MSQTEDPDLDLEDQSEGSIQENEADLESSSDQDEMDELEIDVESDEVEGELVESEDDFELESEEDEPEEIEVDEEESQKPEEPEPPLELQLFNQHQFGDEPIVFKTSAKVSDEGFYLALVIAKSLELSERLSRVELNESHILWETYDYHVSDEAFPFCAINDFVIESYDEQTLHELYNLLNGRSILNQNLLNLWMRAWSPKNDDLFKLIQKSYSLPVLASLVERGANPLAAMKLK